jgi:hypothetical protein
MMSSKRLYTSGVGCSSAMMTVPRISLAQAPMEAQMSYVTDASRPVLISSMHSRRALETSASAMVTRFFSPPDTPRTRLLPTSVSAQPLRLSSLITRSTRLAASRVSISWPMADGSTVLLMQANSAVSRTVRKGRCTSSWST